jgi:5-hydroxyisourate hydrolase-like protein (transthyretin family)
VYWKAVPLRSNRYLLEIAVKDVNGDRVGTWRGAIHVPDFSRDELVSSSLILADKMEPAAAQLVGTDNFVIGSTHLRPCVPGADGKPVSFKRNQRINFWMQVYNLSIDQKTNKPSAVVEFDLVNVADGKSAIRSQQSTDQMGHIADQMTLQKTLSAADLQAGVYKLQVKVSDNISKQAVGSSSIAFAVE